MEAKKKTVRRGFDYRNCDDFAAYLNHMARQGWHFQEWKAGLVFRQGAPEDACYAVEVFTDGSEYDTRPEPKTKEFAEYCEAAGWTLVDAKRKFCIFKRIREDAQPIMTDEERLESIRKATQPEIWTSITTPALFTIMRLIDMDMLFQRQIFHDPSLFFTLLWPALLIMVLIRCALFYRWLLRCRKRVEDGMPLFFGKGRETFAEGWYNRLRTLTIAAMILIAGMTGETWVLLYYLGFIGILVIGAYLIAHFRPDALSNQIIQILGSAILLFLSLVSLLFIFLVNEDSEEQMPPPPLTYAEMGIDLDMDFVRSSDQLRGTLGSWDYYNLDYGQDYLFYHVYRTEHHWILDKIWEGETEGKANETRQDCTGAWGALEAFRNGAGSYLVRYADMILVISPSLDEPFTQAQIDAAIAALREG